MSERSLKQLRRRAELIVIVIAVIVVVYFLLSILEDVVIEGSPITSEPIIGAIISFTLGVTSTVRALGYTGIFVLMLLESSSLPIPSEVILPFAGYLASLGQLNFWLTVIIATIAGIAGSLIDYYIGLKGASTLAERKILGKFILNASQLEIASKWFNQHGPIMIFVSRMIPGFRTVLSFPAGAVRMSLKKFTLYTTAGCIIWNILLIYLGWFLGQNWTEVAGIFHYLILAAIIGAAILIIAFLIRRRKKLIQLRQQGKI